MNATKFVVFTKYYFLEVAKILQVRVIKSIQKKGGRKNAANKPKSRSRRRACLEALTDGEKRTFFESIFSRIVELHQQTQTENKNET